MIAWALHLWQKVRSSLWFLPSVMSIAVMVLALVSARLDSIVAASGATPPFIYRGDAESTRTLLATVAGSMITVAGVSFSVTMVALSLASSQLGPRLLVNFMRDPGNQVVLGGFIATFLFCLLALGSTPVEGEKISSVSATTALVLAVGSLLLLIYFIHHIATSMQADYVVRTVAADVNEHLKLIFAADAPLPGASEGPIFRQGDVLLTSGATGYLQRIDEDGLLSVAAEHDLRLKLLHRPGHYLTPAIPLVQVAAREPPPPDVVSRIRRAFILGGNRSPEQDPEYGINQLVEIALRALSPGINDPFTAITCIDHLSGLLSTIAPLPERPPVQSDDEGVLRLELDPVRFEGVLSAAFDQIRQNSAGTASVSLRILEALALVGAATSHPERLAAIERQARMVYDANQGKLAREDDADLEERFQALLATLRMPLTVDG